jgi:taurine dioxygenase
MRPFALIGAASLALPDIASRAKRRDMNIIPPERGKIGARVTGVDVRELTSEQALALRQAVYQHMLVVLTEQRPSPQEYIAFARQLGRVQVYFQPNYHHPDHPEIFVSSNVPENGRKVGVAGTGQYWHTDYQFTLEPLSTTLVYPQILPKSRRETYYIDMAHVYRSLSPRLREHVEGRRAIAEAKWRYKITAADIDRAIVDILNEFHTLVPPVSHPAVIEHPVTHELSLYLSSGFTTAIEGLPHDVNKRVLAELFEFIQREEHVHTHTWQEGDILYWDNRALLHRAGTTPKGEQSKSYRIGVYDEYPFYVNGTASPAMEA